MTMVLQVGNGLHSVHYGIIPVLLTTDWNWNDFELVLQKVAHHFICLARTMYSSGGVFNFFLKEMGSLCL